MGGLQYASGINDGTLLALLQIDAWRMLAPVRHGDTLHMRSTVVGKKETSSPDRGVVTFARRCPKQDGSAAQDTRATLISRPLPLGPPIPQPGGRVNAETAGHADVPARPAGVKRLARRAIAYRRFSVFFGTFRRFSRLPHPPEPCNEFQ